MSASTRTVGTAPELRQLGLAVGALIVAVALLVAFAISRSTTVTTPAAPAEVPFSVAHDHGWITATGGAQQLVIRGENGGGLLYTGIPYPAPRNEIVIQGENGGGLVYMGIPYPVMNLGSDLGPRERMAQ
jgi:hypothetical protein